ncbi:hypothetical protein ACK1FP_004990, partial [Salmonella enterica]
LLSSPRKFKFCCFCRGFREQFLFAPENSFTVKVCNVVPKRSLLDLLFLFFISLTYVISVRGALAAFRSCKMTKAKNSFVFQMIRFSVRSFFNVNLAKSGNL